MAHDALAEFEDQQTLKYVRFYPVEVPRVWKAVTTSEQLNVWLLPVTRVEPELGGRCSFSWGSPDDPTHEGTVALFQPMKVVRYELGAHSWIQFELEKVEGGTRFTFTQFFGPEFRHADDGELASKDGAQLCGPGTPWRTGFIAGFHVNFSFLETFLTDDWPEERIAKQSQTLIESANAGGISDWPPAPAGEWLRLVDVYYDHVLATYPKV